MRFRQLPAAGLTLVAVLLASCGGAATSAGGGSSPGGGSPGGSSAFPSSPSSSGGGAPASGSATAGAAFSCDIKPGHGLLAGATPAPGRILATVDAIEAAIGFSIDTSVNISEVAGITDCRYQFAGGSAVDVSILDDPARTDTEYAATQSRRLALHDRACNGCGLDSITATTGLGDRSFSAKSDDGSTVIGVVAGGVYFELVSASLKPARMQRLAAIMVGTLTGTTPSLQPLPTPTATPTP